MQALIPFIIIILATLYNTLPAITGYINTPATRQFLGTVHHPMDYFYYLSQFFQGKDHWFFSSDLYTSETVAPVLVGWTNVFAGKLFSLLGIPVVLGYQIVNSLYMAVLLLCAYQFIRYVFPHKSDFVYRVIALVFYIIYSPFPILSTIKPGSIPSFYSYWFNVAETYTRFGGVPHQLLGQIAIIASLLCVIGIISTKKKLIVYISYTCLSLASIVLVSINPVQWVIIGVIIVISLLLEHTQYLKKIQFKMILHTILPVIIYAFAGLPMAVYIKLLFTTLPYSQLISWEFFNTTPSNIWTFLMAHGPIFLLAIPSIPVGFTKQQLSYRMITVYILLSLFLFFTPLAKLLQISNIRILSGIFILIVSIFASISIRSLMSVPSIIYKVLSILSLLVIVVLSGISLYPQTIQRFTSASTNAYIYLPTTVLEAFNYARTHSTDEDVFLPFWPFDSMFPAFTGRKSYMGHQLLTIENADKNGEAYKFIDHQMTEEQMKAFLRKYHITFIFVFTAAMPDSSYPFLKQIYQHDVISIYKVM